MDNSLFYEYAITPDVFHGDYISSDARLETILSEMLKGICDNGMIANLNRDGWIKLINNDRLQTIKSPNFKDKLITYLNTLHDRNRLVRHPRATQGDPSTNLEWLDLALESHRRIKFDGIIGSCPVISASDVTCADFIDALSVLDSAKWMGRRRSLSLTSSEPYYRPVLASLLRHAKKLIIIDPYLSPHILKYKNFMKICVEQMGHRGASQLNGRIQVHVGDPTDKYRNRYPESVEARLNAWQKCIKDLFPQPIPHKIMIFIRKQKIDGNRFHDRFILTDQCCIGIQGGTDTYDNSTPNSTIWTLLDYEVMQEKASEIDPVTKVYETLGEQLIT